jgi:hypothetical protein
MHGSLWLLNIVGVPLIAPPADLRGCEVDIEHGQLLQDHPPDRRATFRFDDQGRIAGISTQGPKAATQMTIRRDAAGCPVEVRQGDPPSGGDPDHGVWVFRATCHPDGSLATWSGEHGDERWSPPRVGADGALIQYGVRIKPDGQRELLRQARRPLAGGAMEVSTWTGGTLNDQQVLSAVAGGVDARPLIELLPWWSDGRMRERRDAEGRLTELRVIGAPRVIQHYAIEWDEDGRSGDAHLLGEWFDEPITCDGPRCALPERGWTQVWSCPAR